MNPTLRETDVLDDYVWAKDSQQFPDIYLHQGVGKRG